MNVGILGAGAWGTALAVALSRQHSVTLWAREDGLPQVLLRDRENKLFLPGIALPEGVDPSAEPRRDPRPARPAPAMGEDGTIARRHPRPAPKG